jgi:hypothetical protein
VGVVWPIPEGETPQLSAKDGSGIQWRDCPLYEGLI